MPNKKCKDISDYYQIYGKDLTIKLLSKKLEYVNKYHFKEKNKGNI